MFRISSVLRSSTSYFFSDFSWTNFDLSEVSGDAFKLSLLPFRVRVIVTLSTVHTLAQKRASRSRRQFVLVEVAVGHRSRHEVRRR